MACRKEWRGQGGFLGGLSTPALAHWGLWLITLLVLKKNVFSLERLMFLITKMVHLPSGTFFFFLRKHKEENKHCPSSHYPNITTVNVLVSFS